MANSLMPHDLDRDDDVGDEELKTVPGKATRLSHACQKQVVCLYLAGPLKLLQVDREELAQGRSDNSQSTARVSHEFEQPVECLGWTRESQAVIARADRRPAP